MNQLKLLVHHYSSHKCHSLIHLAKSKEDDWFEKDEVLYYGLLRFHMIFLCVHIEVNVWDINDKDMRSKCIGLDHSQWRAQKWYCIFISISNSIFMQLFYLLNLTEEIKYLRVIGF